MSRLNEIIVKAHQLVEANKFFYSLTKEDIILLSTEVDSIRKCLIDLGVFYGYDSNEQAMKDFTIELKEDEILFITEEKMEKLEIKHLPYEIYCFFELPK